MVDKSTIRHFLDIDLLDSATLRGILDTGLHLKHDERPSRPLEGKTLAMIFEKPSTRTRVSFQVGMQQLGGSVVLLSGTDSQLGRGETVADTARVLSRYVDAIMIRTDDHDKITEMASHATVPVINGLTDRAHPCQLMADVMTFEQHRGPITGKTVAWAGDGNNMATSWIHAATRFRFKLKIACPEELQPPRDVVDWAVAQGCDLQILHNADHAVAGADCVVTDVWVSMGDTDAPVRHNQLKPFQVDEALMAKAAPDAIFMHCLPAHRGEEATEAVIDGPQSVIWDEAENRMHAQKGILLWCLDKI